MNRITKRKCRYKGIEFDSRDEMERYIALCCQLIRGEISSLHRQVKFEIVPRLTRTVAIPLKTKTRYEERVMERARHYTCDFCYIDNVRGVMVVEDVKSHYTQTMTDYSLRRANMVWKIWRHNQRTHGRQVVFRECVVKKNSFKIKDR